MTVSSTLAPQNLHDLVQRQDDPDEPAQQGHHPRRNTATAKPLLHKTLLNPMVKRAMGICICATTYGNTLSMNGSCEISMVFYTNSFRHCLDHKPTLSKNWTTCTSDSNCRTSTVFCPQPTTCTNGQVNLVQELDSTPMTTCTTGTSSTWSKYCNCGTFTVISTVTTRHQSLYNNGT